MLKSFIARRQLHPKSRPVAILVYDEIPPDTFTVYNTINLSNNLDFTRFEHTLFSRGLQKVTLLVQDVDKLLPAMQKRLFEILKKLAGHPGTKKTKLVPPKPSNPLILHSSTRLLNLPPHVTVMGQYQAIVPQLSDLQAFWVQSGIDFSDMSLMPYEYHETVMELSPSEILLTPRKLKYTDRYLESIVKKSQYDIVDLSNGLFLNCDMEHIEQRFMRSRLTVPYKV